MALFGGSENVDRSPGTQLGRNVVRDAQRATRRTGQIGVPSFTDFQQRAFNLIGQQGVDPSVAAAQRFLPELAGGQFVGQGPGQGTLQQASRGQFVGQGPGQGTLQQFAGGAFQRGGPGQGTLRQAAAGGFQNAARPAAFSALDFSRGISGIPGGLQETAAGGNLASPFISGEFNRITDPIAEQLRNVVLPSVAGTFAGAGRLGSRSFQAAEDRALDAGERAISGVAADLLGRERGFQQQAQLAIPGIQQAQLQGQLGAVGQLGQLSFGDIQNRLGAAGTIENQFAQQLQNRLGAAGALESNFGQQIGQQLGAAGGLQNQFNQQLAQAGQFGLAAPGFAQGALGARVNPLLQAGGQQQARQQQLSRKADDAIQREVERAALLGGAGAGGGFTGQPSQSGGGIGGLISGGLGGALTGATIGSLFAGGAGGGAAAGGTAGALAGLQG